MKQTKRSYDKICEICGALFIKSNNSSKYCSSICATTAINTKARTDYQVKKATKSFERVCEFCKTNFISEQWKKYCNPACKKAVQKITRIKKREKNKRKGICPVCNRRPLVEGKAACQECAEYVNKSHKKMRFNRISKNLCRECGEPAEYTYCSSCMQKNTKRSQKVKQYRRENSLCTECKSQLPKDYNNYLCRECLDKNIEKNLEIKKEVFQHYDNGACSCCGEQILSFLTVDHIYNNGASHRKEINGATGGGIYRWLRHRNFPDGYQVLCFNCNWGKYKNGGVCIHKKDNQYRPPTPFYEKLKKDIFSNYGISCKCCGESQPMFLSIDHINGGGRQHLKKVGNLYSFLRKNGYPKGYQTLCQNCNQGKHINGGICPHKNLV